MKRYICRDCREEFTEPGYADEWENEECCPECGSDRIYDVQPGEILCSYCDEPVMQGDATAGGADSNYGNGAAGTFDYPITTECEECGAVYCDGDEVSGPTDKHYQGATNE